MEEIKKILLKQFQNVAADENQLLTGAESQQAEVRVAFGENQEAQPAEGLFLLVHDIFCYKFAC